MTSASKQSQSLKAGSLVRVGSVHLAVVLEHETSRDQEPIRGRARMHATLGANGQAVRAIGRLCGRQARGFLEQAATLKSPRDIIGRAARTALAEMDKK